MSDDMVSAEIKRLRTALDAAAHAHERDLLRLAKALGFDHEPPSDVDAMVAAAEAQRAIIEGRTTAPTEEETVALFASGGQWMVTWDDGTLGKITTVPYWRHMASKVRRWIPVLDGRPTTWPVVTP